MLELRALHRLHIGPVDLRVEAGECVSVMGASGAGKSVLLRMVADLDPAMPAPAWRRQVTYVPAESGWWAETVAEHFAPDADLPALLPTLGLDAALAQAPVVRCSTGERQRLALLRALRPHTRVLLLDEPTSGLDPAARARVEQMLRQRLDAGGTILLVTHDIEQARRLARRRFVIERGQLQEQTAEGHP